MSILSGRRTVESELEADFVVAMRKWFNTVRSGDAANTLPRIVAPDYWHVTDIRRITIVLGEAESDQYRSRRLEVLLCAMTGRFITFDELDLVRRERDPATRYRLENLTSPNAMGELMHFRLAAHV